VLAAGIFKLIGAHNLERPIEEFRKTLLTLQIDVISDKVHAAMVDILDSDFPGKFLAVLFKSPTSSKHVFDLALAKAAS
jgi:hypothetical protein